MKSHRNLIRIAVFGLVVSSLALVGVACGGDDMMDNQTPPTTQTPPATDINDDPEPTASDWELVWSDEFDGDTIDRTQWNFEINCWGGGNNESQCYTDSTDNAFIDDGVLNIVALREDTMGNSGQDGQSGAAVTRPYSSARLTTQDKNEWTYGRFEIRAKLPFGQGSWPALWLLHNNSPYGGWPAGGEIDIVEAINLKADDDEGNPENRVHGTLHYGREGANGHRFSGTSYRLPDDANPADDFHIYALEWEEGEIRWYVDGEHYATQNEEGWYTQYPARNAETNEIIRDEATGEPVYLDGLRGAPFNTDFFLIMNLAVGGNWPAGQNEGGIDESVFPQTFEIDYVRVFECSSGQRGGRGCATVGDDATLVMGHLPPGVAPEGYAQPPLYSIFDDGINPVGIRYNSWNPDGIVSWEEEDDAERGKILTINKSENAGGNVYFESTGGSINFNDWEEMGVLEFDYRVNSIGEDVTLLVKIDSGWPSVSDVTLDTSNIGEWQTFRIGVADLVDRGNSLAAGEATLGAVTNVFVMDPVQGPINVSFDNIRYVEGDAPPPTTSTGGDDSGPPAGYGQPPEYVVFGRDGINTDGNVLNYQGFMLNETITYEEVDDAERGKILTVNKTDAAGNVFFNSSAGPINMSAWSSMGEIAFDYRVNSAADGVGLLVKIDAGWPNVSDVSIPVGNVGEWQSYSIGVADLADNGNSIDPSGNFDLSGVVNVFVIEPTGVMNVSFANIRYTGGDAGATTTEPTGPPEGYAQPPDDYVVFGRDGINTEADILNYQGFMLPEGNISYEEVDDAERGKILTINKTVDPANLFFNSSAGAIDMSAWSADGRIAFDYRVNSAADGVGLLVKIDSGWPNVSDVSIPVGNVGEWQSYSIGVADLADNGNSIDPSGNFDLSGVVNVFVIEPTGVMNVSFANIRYTEGS